MRRPPTNEEARGACDLLAALAPLLVDALTHGQVPEDARERLDRALCALGVDFDVAHVPPHVEAAMTWATGR